MSDPTPPPETPASAPAVSPTGAPTLSQSFIKYAAPAIGLLAAIGFAPEALKAAGIDMPPLPPIGVAVIAWCKVLAVLGGGYFGIKSQGQRVLPMVLLVLAVGFSSCAHASALQISGDTIDAAAITEEATYAGMASANEQGLLSGDQVTAFNAFHVNFVTTFHVAAKAWRAARAKGDQPAADQAAAVLASLLGQLSVFTAMLEPKGGGAR